MCCCNSQRRCASACSLTAARLTSFAINKALNDKSLTMETAGTHWDRDPRCLDIARRARSSRLDANRARCRSSGRAGHAAQFRGGSAKRTCLPFKALWKGQGSNSCPKGASGYGRIASPSRPVILSIDTNSGSALAGRDAMLSSTSRGKPSMTRRSGPPPRQPRGERCSRSGGRRSKPARGTLCVASRPRFTASASIPSHFDEWRKRYRQLVKAGVVSKPIERRL